MVVDKSTTSWDNLEYARLQVRILKNHNVRMAKGLRINGEVYSIFIEEEYPSVSEGQCKCSDNHYASSDSVTSSESFVAETVVFVSICEKEFR